MENISILTTKIPFDKTDFFSLMSLAAGTAIARQKRFGEQVIGESGWNVDFKERTVKFGESVFPCGILGSESETENTWLWGWANTESGINEAAFAPSRRAKRSLSACEEFTTAKFELDELHTGHNLAMTAVGASEKNACYYRCPYSGGAVFIQVEGLPEAVFEPLSLAEIPRLVAEIIGSLYCDHRLLTAGILHLNGFDFDAEDSFIRCGGLRFDFENVGGLSRVVSIGGSIG